MEHDKERGYDYKRRGGLPGLVKLPSALIQSLPTNSPRSRGLPQRPRKPPTTTALMLLRLFLPLS
ncbi:hypothetical protein BD413DRAFT_578122 [Trametes elegans]|nr:hypothetical protein BD413DRAFT_578122 [Trametes elegans]